MKDLNEDIRALFSESENLVRKEVELFKMDMVEKTAKASGKIVAIVLIVRISIIFLGLLGISLIMLLGRIIGYDIAVYIVTGFFALLCLFLLIYRKRLIVKPFMDHQLGEYLKDQDKKNRERAVNDF